MIDNIKIAAPLNDRIRFDEDGYPWIGKLKLAPYFSPKTLEIIKYHCEYRGLIFTVIGSELKIANSIHKFKQGNNFNDFSFNMLVQTINEIENLTGLSAFEFRIIKLEFGLNIITETSTSEYMAYFSDFKGINYNKMLSINSWYGVKYRLTDYALKIYDKTYQVSKELRCPIQPNITRVEMELKKVYRYVQVSTLEELKNAEVLYQLFDYFIDKIKRINCQGSEDFTNCTSRHRELYFAGKSTEFWLREKQNNINTAKSKRKLYRKIQKKVIRENPMDKILLLLHEKFEDLMNK